MTGREFFATPAARRDVDPAGGCAYQERQPQAGERT